MAKHTREESRVQSLLDTITGSDGVISVVGIDKSNFVQFKTRDSMVQKLQTLLNAPKALATTIWRAVKGSEEEALLNFMPKEQDEQDINAKQLLETIITSEGIESLGLNPFVENGFHIVTSCTESRSKPATKRVESGAELIGLALNHPGFMDAILNQGRSPITKEDDLSELDDAVTMLDQNIFAIYSKDKEVTASFNAAAFVQMMQKYTSFSSSSPVIARLMSVEDTYTLNLDHLQLYMGSKVSPLVFKPIGRGESTTLEPIALFPENYLEERAEAESNFLCSIAIDISGSMHSNLPVCKEKARIIFNQIINTAENWTIIITKFSDNSSQQLFQSTGHKVNDLKNLCKYVDSFVAGGNTKLLGTMHNQHSDIERLCKQYTHCAAMVITDGLDNVGGHTEEGVLSYVRKLKSGIDNLQIYTLELGSQNKKFFTNLASEGCTHILLGAMSDMAEFGQYTAHLSRDSKVVQFLLDSSKLYQMTVAKGKIAVGHMAVTPNTEVIYGHEKYSIASPTATFSDIFSVEEKEGVELAVLGAAASNGGDQLF